MYIWNVLHVQDNDLVDLCLQAPKNCILCEKDGGI